MAGLHGIANRSLSISCLVAHIFVHGGGYVISCCLRGSALIGQVGTNKLFQLMQESRSIEITKNICLLSRLVGITRYISNPTEQGHPTIGHHDRCLRALVKHGISCETRAAAWNLSTKFYFSYAERVVVDMPTLCSTLGRWYSDGWLPPHFSYPFNCGIP